MPSLKRTEHDEQSLVIQWAKLNEGRYPCLHWLFAIPNGGKRGKWERGQKISEGLKSGVFDLFLPFPSCSMNGLFIEMKAFGGRVRPEQKEFMEFARASMYKAEICYGADQAISVIENYLIWTKPYDER